MKMKNLKTNLLSKFPRILALTFVVTLLTACNLGGFKTAPGKKGPGDAGGGDATKSDIKAVEYYINHDLRDRLKTVFHRIEYYYSHSETHNSSATNILPLQVSNLFVDIDVQSFIDQVKIVAQKEDCLGKLHESKDGSAFDNTICLSSTRLARIPNETLTMEIDALAAHELAHLRGANEADAQIVQKWFLNSQMTSFTTADLKSYVFTDFVSYKNDIRTILREIKDFIGDSGELKADFDRSYFCERILLLDNKEPLLINSKYYPGNLLRDEDSSFMVTRISNLHTFYCQNESSINKAMLIDLLRDLERAFWIIQQAQAFILRFENPTVLHPELLFAGTAEAYYLHWVPLLIDLLQESVQLSEVQRPNCQSKFDDQEWMAIPIQSEATFWSKGENQSGLIGVGVFKGPENTEFNLKMYSYYPNNFEGIRSSLFVKLMSRIKDVEKIPYISLQHSEFVIPTLGNPIEPTATITGGYNESFHMKLTIEGHPLEVRCESK